MSKPPLEGKGRHGLLGRILYASGLTTTQLAWVMDITREELEALLSLTRGRTVETDMDEMWARLDAYVNEQIGLLMAIREDINRKRQADIKARLERLTRMRQR